MPRLHFVSFYLLSFCLAKQFIFIASLLSKVGASAGYAAGNVLKVPFDKKLNPISKQYEWIPTGVWTITKPTPQHPLPSIMGNVGDSALSGMVQDKLKDGGGK